VPGQIGLEPTIHAWVDELRLVMNGLARVLKPTGSLWLNLGDTYSRHARYGAPRKSLLLGPERLLLALSGDSWIARNAVIWAKTNPMPHSVSDRLTNTHDLVYFLTRSPNYFFDLDAIRLPHRSTATHRRGDAYPPAHASAPLSRHRGGGNRGLATLKSRGEVGHELGKNPGDVWVLPSANFGGQHFATFPPRLVERPLLATCPELICNRCSTPFRRTSRVERRALGRRRPRPRRAAARVRCYDRRYSVVRTQGPLLPRCACGAPAKPGVVLDPFFGAGTVGLVAEEHRRDWIGIEINPAYVRIAQKRLSESRANRAADGAPVDETLGAVASTAQPSISERRSQP
jgi:site-specific DNA-methyltransferase (adenine-specific)